MMIRKWTTEIGVTSHRFVEKYGLLVACAPMRSPCPISKACGCNQSFLGRIFGYGTVRIEGTGVDAVTTPNIADPVGFVRAIQTAQGTCPRHERFRAARQISVRRLDRFGQFQRFARDRKGDGDAGALAAGAVDSSCWPPCSSTSALVSGRPRPVPS